MSTTLGSEKAARVSRVILQCIVSMYFCSKERNGTADVEKDNKMLKWFEFRLSLSFDPNLTCLNNYFMYVCLYVSQVSREADSNIKELAVNIDSNLQQILKEVHYLQRPPLEKRLPDVIRALIRNTDPALLQTNAARLSTVVSQYNIMIRTISDIEKPLFELKLSKIDQVNIPSYNL